MLTTCSWALLVLSYRNSRDCWLATVFYMSLGIWLKLLTWSVSVNDRVIYTYLLKQFWLRTFSQAKGLDHCLIESSATYRGFKERRITNAEDWLLCPWPALLTYNCAVLKRTETTPRHPIIVRTDKRGLFFDAACHFGGGHTNERVHGKDTCNRDAIFTLKCNVFPLILNSQETIILYVNQLQRSRLLTHCRGHFELFEHQFTMM